MRNDHFQLANKLVANFYQKIKVYGPIRLRHRVSYSMMIHTITFCFVKIFVFPVKNETIYE